MARDSYGALFQTDAGSTGTFYSLGIFSDFKGPESVVSDVDITGVNQATNVKKSVAGMIEPGNAELTCFYTDTDFAAANSALGTTANFKATIDSDTYTWDGYVNKVGGFQFGIDNAIMYTVGVKCNSTPTIA